MTTTGIGHQAENAAASHLKSLGYTIISQNWRNRVCEIDLIADKDSIVYFAEVKYRTSTSQGEGLDYITSRKLAQMRFAAQVWVQHCGWEGDWRLLAVSVSSSGSGFKIDDVIELH